MQIQCHVPVAISDNYYYNRHVAIGTAETFCNMHAALAIAGYKKRSQNRSTRSLPEFREATLTAADTAMSLGLIITLLSMYATLMSSTEARYPPMILRTCDDLITNLTTRGLHIFLNAHPNISNLESEQCVVYDTRG